MIEIPHGIKFRQYSIYYEQNAQKWNKEKRHRTEFALTKMCKTMIESNQRCTMIGGASLTFNGLKIQGKDIDIEIDKEGVYCFQEQFSR